MKKYTIKQIIHGIFSKIESYKSKNHINRFATLYINLRMLPFSMARKFPIYVYGHVELAATQGKIEVDSDNIFRGMIKIGRHRDFYTVDYKTIVKISRGGGNSF